MTRHRRNVGLLVRFGVVGASEDPLTVTNGPLAFVQLEPGAKRELPLKLSVEYPSDFPIQGLE